MVTDLLPDDVLDVVKCVKAGLLIVTSVSPCGAHTAPCP